MSAPSATADFAPALRLFHVVDHLEGRLYGGEEVIVFSR